MKFFISSLKVSIYIFRWTGCLSTLHTAEFQPAVCSKVVEADDDSWVHYTVDDFGKRMTKSDKATANCNMCPLQIFHSAAITVFVTYNCSACCWSSNAILKLPESPSPRKSQKFHQILVSGDIASDGWRKEVDWEEQFHTSQTTTRNAGWDPSTLCTEERPAGMSDKYSWRI